MSETPVLAMVVGKRGGKGEVYKFRFHFSGKGEGGGSFLASMGTMEGAVWT